MFLAFPGQGMSLLSRDLDYSAAMPDPEPATKEIAVNPLFCFVFVLIFSSFQFFASTEGSYDQIILYIAELPFISKVWCWYHGYIVLSPGMDWIFVSPRDWAHPHVMVFEDGAFGSLGSAGMGVEPWWTGAMPSSWRGGLCSLSLLCHARMPQAVYSLAEGARHNLTCWHPDLGLSASRTMRNTFPLLINYTV